MKNTGYLAAQPNVAIVLVNWNNWKDSIECLESLQKLDYQNYLVILVDNGSDDGSIIKIKEWCEGKIRVETDYVEYNNGLKPVGYVIYDKDTAKEGGLEKEEILINGISSNKRIVIIDTKENLGFSKANNLAIQYASQRKYDYFWILNNDTVVDQNALIELVKFAHEHPKVGIVGSEILDYKQKNVVLDRGRNYVIWPLFKDRKNTRLENKFIKVKWLVGASLLVKKQMIEKIGMLDENYFIYGEDKDWCITALKKGWDLYCVKASKLWHKEGSSLDIKNREKIKVGIFKLKRLPLDKYSFIVYYECRNGLYLIRKHFPLLFFPYLIFRTFNLIAQVILFDGDKLKRISICLKAVWDASINRMGKTVEYPKAYLS